MADSQAWAEGAAIGSERAKEHRAHKQALSEEERQSKAQLYASNLTNLQQKISSLPKGSQEYNDAFNEIQNNLHGVRELYDPDRHPGLIASHGHLITDALGITNPATNPGIKKEAARRAAGVEGDERAAQGIAAAAPLSPEQQGTQRGQGQAAEDLAVFNGKMKIYDQQNPHASSPDATPEEKQARQDHINELINSTSGVKEPKEPIETWTDVKGAVAEEYPKGSGQYRILQQNKKGERHWGDALAPDAPKQGKLTNADEQRESYRLTHNIPSGQKLTWDQEKDFVKQLGLARNPFGPAHIEIAREGLNLREQESGLKDFMSLQKQLTPLERVISTSQQSEDYVKNPTGPGDVALTLAFFDAIKTTGVRFTKQEQDFIVNSRGVLDGFQAAYDRGFQGTVFSPDQRAIVASIVKKAGETAEKQKGILVGGAGQFNPKAAAAASGGGTTSNAGGASGSDIPPRPKPTKPGPSGAGMVYHRGDKKWHWSMTGNDDLGQVE